MSEIGLKSVVPILFVRDVSASAKFFREKLGFEIDFLHGAPPFYGSVSRGEVCLHLRFVAAFLLTQVCAGAARSTAMQTNPRHYWFPAKRYGWGWGPPISWQGWLVLAAFFALIAAGLLIVPPAAVPERFIAYVAVISVVLTAVCWIKGEPPRWRWGKE